MNVCQNQATSTINGVKNVLEYTLPGTTVAQTSVFYEGDFNMGGGKPYAFKANTRYTIALELWGDNTNITKDFSIVAFGKNAAVKITHTAGLTSDNYFRG